MKKKSAKPKKNDIYLKIKTGWMQIRPVLLFVLVFSVLMILFYALWMSELFEKNVQPGITSFNAIVARVTLNLFGQKVFSFGDLLYSTLFSTSVKKGCDAVEAMALFTSAVLTFPASWKHKLIGVPIGVSILFVLNIVRLDTLFLVGSYFPDYFDIMHVEIWQIIFIIFGILLFFIWLRWSTKQFDHVKH